MQKATRRIRNDSLGFVNVAGSIGNASCRLDRVSCSLRRATFSAGGPTFSTARATWILGGTTFPLAKRLFSLETCLGLLATRLSSLVTRRRLFVARRSLLAARLCQLRTGRSLLAARLSHGSRDVPYRPSAAPRWPCIFCSWQSDGFSFPDSIPRSRSHASSWERHVLRREGAAFAVPSDAFIGACGEPSEASVSLATNPRGGAVEGLDAPSYDSLQSGRRDEANGLADRLWSRGRHGSL